MTTSEEISVICDCCGEKSEQHEIYSYSTAGSDLDLREHHLGFDPIYLFIQKCPKCGFCAYKLDKYSVKASDPEKKDAIKKELEIIKTFIKTEAYQAQLRDTSMHQAANKYFCSSMIYEHLGELEMAASSAQRGAWICDDFRDAMNADILRVRSARFYLLHLDKAKDIKPENINGLKLIITDLYRRAGEFEKAGKMLNDVDLKQLTGAVLDVAKIQDKLIQAKNKSVKSFEDYQRFSSGEDKSENEVSGKDMLF